MLQITKGIAAVAASALLAWALGLVPAPALAQSSGAEAFIRQSADSTLALLKDGSPNDQGRGARMKALMSSILDLRRMALFALGPAAKNAKPPEIDAYVAAYRDFALASYAGALSGYMGQKLRITGSTQRSPGDFIVSAVVVDPNEKGNTPVSVSFRVLDEGAGKFALVDAAVAGVWFTLAQRDDFAGFLAQNGSDISGLIGHLKQMAAHPRPERGSPG